MRDLRIHQNQRLQPAGIVLLVVLLVVAMLALGAYSFVQLMNIEARGAQSFGRQVQALEAADSAVHYTAGILLDQKTNGVLGTDLFDAPSMFQAQAVTQESIENSRFHCRFSVIAGTEETSSSSSYRFGLEDEAAKINLNTLVQLVQSQGTQTGPGTGGGQGTGTGGGSGSVNPLLSLPNMTQEIADAILDWLDEDDTPREYGAESEYYQSLNPPYLPRNGPIHSLDELLLVAGVTPRLLYGEDANRNGLLDPNEDDGALSYPSDDSNGSLDRGWAPYLTLYSRESNADVLGNARIKLNNQDLQSLYDELAQDEDIGEEKALFIVAYRLFGPASTQESPAEQEQTAPAEEGTPQQSGRSQPGALQNQPSNGSNSSSQSNSSSASSSQTIAGMDASGGAKQSIQSVIDLIGVNVNAKMAGQQQTTVLRSPFQDADMDQFLDTLLDRTTTVEQKEWAGRVNVNTAPWAVLMALPGMTEELADSIVSARGQSTSSTGSDSNAGVAWLLSDGTLTKDQFKRMEAFMTGQTQVFRVQAAGYFEEGGPVARVEAVIDVSGPSPRVRYWRDLTQLGRGFSPRILMGALAP